MLFCNFRSGDAANNAMVAFNKRSDKYNGTQIKCKPDLSIEPRTCRTFLLSLRWKMVTEWGYGKSEVKVDENTMTMSVARNPVLSVAVKNDLIELTWLDDTWSAWAEFRDSKDLKDITDEANKKLEQAAVSRSKGGGKGKKGQ